MSVKVEEPTTIFMDNRNDVFLNNANPAVTLNKKAIKREHQAEGVIEQALHN